MLQRNNRYWLLKNKYVLPYMSLIVRKPDFCISQISFAVTAKLISTFVFSTHIVQSLYFLNPNFQASCHLLWLYSPVCVGPGRKPRRPVFSERGSYIAIYGLCSAFGGLYALEGSGFYPRSGLNQNHKKVTCCHLLGTHTCKS